MIINRTINKIIVNKQIDLGLKQFQPTAYVAAFVHSVLKMKMAKPPVAWDGRHKHAQK